MIKVQYDDLLEFADGIEIRNYSGRGMYGKYCLGIVTSSISDFINFVVDVTRSVVEADNEGTINPLEEFLDRIGNVSTDNMAFDIIYYWPGVQLEGYEEE